MDYIKPIKQRLRLYKDMCCNGIDEPLIYQWYVKKI